jgi:hypothetical protein
MGFQLSIFDERLASDFAEAGLSLAIESAERKQKDWKRIVWQHFLLWLRRKKRFSDEFMIEDFRKYLEDYDLVEMPPSLRAFGFISKKAVREGWIIFAGIKKCKNVKAHATPVNVWVRR